MNVKKRIVVLSGAGLDAESGIATFRSKDGTWAKVDVAEVCTPEAWEENPTKVNNFYNERRVEMLNANPNKAHFDLAKAEEEFEIVHLTQNVSDLLERAGCSNVIHLHGELLKARSSNLKLNIENYPTYPVGHEGLDLNTLADDGHLLRPDIVFFGETLPKYSTAVYEIQKADALIVIGTSLQVYPVASLPCNMTDYSAMWLVDPSYNIETIYNYPIKGIRANATNGVEIALGQIRKYFNDINKN